MHPPTCDMRHATCDRQRGGRERAAARFRRSPLASASASTSRIIISSSDSDSASASTTPPPRTSVGCAAAAARANAAVDGSNGQGQRRALKCRGSGRGRPGSARGIRSASSPSSHVSSSSFASCARVVAVLRGYSWVLRQSALQPARGIPPPGFGVRILRRWQPRYLKHQRATAGRSIHSEHRAIYSEHRAIYSIRGRPPAALFIAIIAHRGRSALEQREPSVFLLVQPVQPEEVPAAQTQTNQLFPLGAVPTRPFPLSLVPT